MHCTCARSLYKKEKDALKNLLAVPNSYCLQLPSGTFCAASERCLHLPELHRNLSLVNPVLRFHLIKYEICSVTIMTRLVSKAFESIVRDERTYMISRKTVYIIHCPMHALKRQQPLPEIADYLSKRFASF